MAALNDLRAFLANGGVIDPLIEHFIKEGLVSVELLGDWFDEAKGVTEAITASPIEEQFKRAQSAIVKGLRRLAKAQAERRTSLLSRGMPEEWI